MIPSITNIRKAIYCLNKRIDLLEGGEYSSTVTQLSNKVAALESLLDDDALNPTAAIDKFNEIVAFLNSIDNTEILLKLLKDEIFDISAYNNNAKYADLSAALGTDGANIPQNLRNGGMSVKFVQSSDNKYVQFRCMAQSFTTDVTQWQGVESNPTYSSNLVDGRGIVSHLEHFELTGKGNNGVSVYLEYIIPGKTYILSMDKTWLKPTDALLYFQIYYRPTNGEAIELVSVSSYDVIPSLLCKEYVLTIPQDAGDGKLQVWSKIPQDVTIKFSIKERVDITPKEYGTNLVEEGSVKRLENAINGITQERNYLINTLITRQGALTTDGAYNVGTTDKLDVEAGDEIIFYTERAQEFYRIAFYDSSDTPLSVTDNIEGGVMVTAPADTSYMRYSFAISDKDKAYALVTNKDKRYILFDGMLSVDERTDIIVNDALKKALNTPKQIVIKRYSERSFMISFDSKYIVSSSYGTTFIPVYVGERYKVTANSNYVTIIAFLTDRQYDNNETVHFCTAYPERIVLAANESGEYVIPNDCLYMAVLTKNGNGENTTPTVELIEKKYLEENEEQSKFVLPYTDYQSLYQSHFLSGGEQWTTLSDRGCLLVNIPDNATDIVVNAVTSHVVVAFFTTNNINFNAAPPYVGNSIRMTVWQGENVKIEIPTGAKILYIFLYNSDDKHDISFLTTSDVTEVLDETSYGTFTDLDTTQATMYNNMFIGSTIYPDKWNYIDGRGVGMLAIPANSKYLKITPQLNSTVFYLLKNNKTPVSQKVAELSEGYKDRMVLPVGSSYIFPLLSDCKYIAYVTTNASGNDITPLLSVASKATKASDEIIEEKCECFAGNEIWDVEFNDNPETLFTNVDSGDAFATFPNVVKISDSMYYMYYCIGPAGQQIDDNNTLIKFAYSTDGLHWTREIPQGLSNNNPNVSGNTLLEHRIGQKVVKVLDNEYPFRMICFTWHQAAHMYKSADGINWTCIKTYPFYYDNEPSVIVRGNVLKIYFRRRDGENRQDRYIGIVTVDYDGNVLTTPTIFFGKYYYNAGASALDDRREIMFPTFFNTTDDTCFLDCFIVDNNKIYPRNVDFTKIQSNNINWMTISGGIINIGNDFYIYYVEYNISHNATHSYSPDEPHDSSVVPTLVTTLKRAKITFVNTGQHWYPQP